MNSNEDERIVNVKKIMNIFPDFPKKGIQFCDILPVLQNPSIFKGLISKMVEVIKEHAPDVEIIVGLEARGFLFGPQIAIELNVGFVPIRKKGKLPGPTQVVDYKLEYGEASFEIQASALKENQKVVIIDDLCATGGTLRAAVELVSLLKSTVQLCVVVVELECFIGKRLESKVPIHSLMLF